MGRKTRVQICLLLLCVIGTGFHQKRKLSEAEAVRKAEEFVARQGYTDAPPVKDKSKWSPDPVWGEADEEVMKFRRNSLEPRAYGIARGDRATDPYTWVVVFRMNPNHEGYRQVIPDYGQRAKRVGHAVTMDAYGGRVKMEHQDFYLEFEGLKKLTP